MLTLIAGIIGTLVAAAFAFGFIAAVFGDEILYFIDEFAERREKRRRKREKDKERAERLSYERLNRIISEGQKPEVEDPGDNVREIRPIKTKSKTR